MTDNEILRVFKYCQTETFCNNCPWYNTEKCENNDLTEKVLGIINRQKEEIERYKGVIKLLEKDVECEKVEIENLKVELKAMRGADNSYKNEAIKEFAKLIIDKSPGGVIRTADIPDFVKEMTEE